MDELEEWWPDTDKRDAALLRLARRIALQGKPSSELTASQQRVVQAASFGLTNEEIADVLGLTLEGVKSGLKMAQRSLRAKGRTHACCEALRRGLIS